MTDIDHQKLLNIKQKVSIEINRQNDIYKRCVYAKEKMLYKHVSILRSHKTKKNVTHIQII